MLATDCVENPQRSQTRPRCTVPNVCTVVSVCTTMSPARFGRCLVYSVQVARTSRILHAVCCCQVRVSGRRCLYVSPRWHLTSTSGTLLQGFPNETTSADVLSAITTRRPVDCVLFGVIVNHWPLRVYPGGCGATAARSGAASGILTPLQRIVRGCGHKDNGDTSSFPLVPAGLRDMRGSLMRD